MWTYPSVKYLKRKNTLTESQSWEIKYCSFYLLWSTVISWTWSFRWPVRKYPQYSQADIISYSACVYRVTAFNHFRDEDIRDRCENQCETDFVDCTLPCDDTNCLLECGRILTECVNGTFSLYFQITNTVYTIRYESWTKTFNLIYFKIAHVTPIARMDVLIAQIYFVSVETILHHKTKIIWRRAKMRKALI